MVTVYRNQLLFGIFGIAIICSLINGVVSAQKYDRRQACIDDYLKEGIEYYRDAEFDKTVELAWKAIDLKPESVTAWRWLGKAYYRLGYMQEAISAFRKSLSFHHDPELQRKVDMYASENSELSDKFVQNDTFIGKKDGKAAFFTPTGITTDAKGNIYIVSFGNHRILKFNQIGTLLTTWGGKGKEKGQFNHPYGIAIDHKGSIYITDFDNGRVQKFTNNGTFINTFGKRGKGEGEFITPKGITVDGLGNIYVVDGGNRRVQKFNSKGRFLSYIGESDVCRLFQPVGIAIDRKGYIWVSDSGNDKLLKFDSSGNFLMAIPLKGEPRGISIGIDGNLYIATAKRGVLRLNPDDGSFLTSPLIYSSKKPSLSASFDCVMNSYGSLYVVDSEKDTCEVFIPKNLRMKAFDFHCTDISTAIFPRVNCLVRITAKDQYILGLNTANFKVLQNNVRMLPISVSSVLQDNNSLDVIFVIDNSTLMEPHQEKIKELLYNFINDLSGGIQKVGIVPFNSQGNHEITLNKSDLRNVVEKLSFTGNRNQEIAFSTLKKTTKLLINQISKKIIIFITSGDYVENGILLDRVVFYAKNNYIPISIVDFREEGENIPLSSLAEQTGGLYIPYHNDRRVKKLYKTITDLVKCQNVYLISYVSPATEWSGTWVDVDIIGGHRYLYANDHMGYFVPPDGGPSDAIIMAEKEKAREEEAARKAKEIYKQRLGKLKKYKAEHEKKEGGGEKEKEGGGEKKKEGGGEKKKEGGGGH